ncbi:MAG: phosphoenolpyruvate carboxykinase domain-containing protein, partial [Planctomycetota bacterium]
NTIPLVNEAYSWQHGTFLGSFMSSEKTAAATGAVGQLRRDPMAMLPFCGYHMADYWQHWLDIGKQGGATPDDPHGRMPRIFHVNWFRKTPDGKWLWPGFGDNVRVLAWLFDRCDDIGQAIDTPIGKLPMPDAIDVADLGMTDDDMRQLLDVDPAAWADEAASIAEYYEQFGDKLPPAFDHELGKLAAAFD